MVDTPCNVHAPWSGNVLDAARQAFAWLTAGEHPVAVDGRLFEHLPDRQIPVDELRDLLLRRGCPRRVWDQVWAHVITRARCEGGTWTVVIVGLALPMLTPMATRLTRRYADDPADIHAEVLRGFLEALDAVDLSRGRLVIRLRWAAYRAGRRALLTALDGPTPSKRAEHARGLDPASGHPDVVLARAVAIGVLSRDEAALIGATRLEGRALSEWAAESDSSYERLRKARRRAEHRLATWLTDTTEDTGPASNTTARKAAMTVSDRPVESGLQDCQ